MKNKVVAVMGVLMIFIAGILVGYHIPHEIEYTMDRIEGEDTKYAYIDINDNGNEIIDWLITNKLGKLTGRICHSGFCMYPEFEFDMDEVQKYVE